MTTVVIQMVTCIIIIIVTTICRICYRDCLYYCYAYTTVIAALWD